MVNRVARQYAVEHLQLYAVQVNSRRRTDIAAFLPPPHRTMACRERETHWFHAPRGRFEGQLARIA